jgi:hypothetical protein
MLLSDLAVHREQAGGPAQFFDPRQPQKLADAMLRLLQTPIENFESRHPAAAQASEDAQRVYAVKLRAALAAAAAG